MESISSVTVTYNAESQLDRHLSALLGQGRALNEIVVVNNASTDGTLQLLAERYPQVTVLNLPKNLGVGGGYATGLDYAVYKRKHKWVWLFDQDSIPSESALASLLDGLARLGQEAGEVAILAPICAHQGTKLFYPGLSWRHGWRRARSDSRGSAVSFVDAVISSGTLIRSEAVERVGPPRTDFFIDYVDFEHCLRLRRHGYKIAIVPESLVEHEMGEPKRITLLGFSLAWADHVPWREYYLTRNEIFTIWEYCPGWRAKLSVARRLLRHSAGILLFGKQKGACLRMIYLGIVDGRARKLGIRFPEQLGATTTAPQ